MNASQKLLSSALIAVASLTAASAFAGDQDYPGVQASPASTLTRAEVRADLMQAKRAGTTIQQNKVYPTSAADSLPELTRAEVRAELSAQQQPNSARIVHNS